MLLVFCVVLSGFEYFEICSGDGLEELCDDVSSHVHMLSDKCMVC